MDKLNASQKCTAVAKQAKHMLGCISKSVAEENHSSPLFRAYEIHSTWSTVYWGAQNQTRIKLPPQRNLAEDHTDD